MKTNAATRKRSETRRAMAPRRRILPALIAGCFASGAAFANPMGAQVVNGQVSFSNQGNVLSITNTPGAIINWQSFSINAGETTRFIQQSTNSAVLNRIVGQDPSKILGALQSNGRVFLINPNGILFGAGATIDVNGLIASTLNISNEDFLAGRMNFKIGDKAGDLKNEGAITTPSGGKVYLIAPNVENSGIITSPKGEVMLAAGHTVQLVDSVNPDMHVVISAPEHQALNLGQVITQGGKTGIYGALVQQRGIVSADSAVVGENGKIVFKASREVRLGAGSITTANGVSGGSVSVEGDGATLIEGMVQAKGESGKGGNVHVLGEQVGVMDGAAIDASGTAGGGTVLVGGDYQGKGAVRNAAVTYTDGQASIKADATANGDGGKVIVWADDTTRSYAHISARGGEEGGNGGFVETSGKRYLDVGNAYPDVRAPKGKAGEWLLDPDDITIQNATNTNITGLSPFTPAETGNSVLDTATLQAYLQTTGNATVQTASTGGNIYVNDAINVNMSTPGSLSLIAHNDININAPVSSTGETLNLNLTAGFDNGGVGNININSTVNLNSGSANLYGAAVNVGSAGSISASDSVYFRADNLDLQGSITANSVDITTNALSSRGIRLGVGTPDELSITSAELQTIQAEQLRIGNYAEGGAITVSEDIVLSNSRIGKLSVHTAGEINVNGAIKMVDLVPNSDSPTYLHLISSNGALTLNSGTEISGWHDVLLTSGGGALTLKTGSSVMAGTEHPAYTALTLTSHTNSSAGAIVMEAGSAISGTHNITLRADDMTLGGSIKASNAAYGVGISAFSSSREINLGTKAPDKLGLTSAELQNIEANHLSIGDSATSSITVSDDLAFSNAKIGSLGLWAVGNIDVYGALKLNDATPDTVSPSPSSVNLESQNGSLTLHGGAEISGWSNVHLHSGGGPLTMKSGSTIMSSADDTYYGNINLSSQTGSSSGAITLEAGSSISSKHRISLRADDMTLGGIIQAKNTTDPYYYSGVSIDPYSSSRSIDLGTKAAGKLGLTSAELQNIEADFLDIGNYWSHESNGGITVSKQIDLSAGKIKEMSLSTTSGAGITIQPTGGINMGVNGDIGFQSDSLALGGAVKAHLVDIRPHTNGRSITIGSTTCHVEPCLTVTKLYNVDAPTIGIGDYYYYSPEPVLTAETTPIPPYTWEAGSIHVAAITQGNGSALSDRNANTTRIGLLTGGDVTQSGAINVQDLGIEAGGRVELTNSANKVSNLAGWAEGGDFVFTNSQNLTVANLIDDQSGYDFYGIYGIWAMGGNVSLTTLGSGDITLHSTIHAEDYENGVKGNVSLRAAGAISQNITALPPDSESPYPESSYEPTYSAAISVMGAHLNAEATRGIALSTLVDSLSATNNDSSGSSAIAIDNYRPVILHDVKQAGAGSGVIRIAGHGGLTVAAGKEVSTGSGSIYLVAHSPLTVDGAVTSATGAIVLEAGTSGSGDDNLVLNGPVSTGGSVLLKAGNSIAANGKVTSPKIVEQPNASTTDWPSVDPCMLDPSLSGCSPPPPPPPPPPPTSEEPQTPADVLLANNTNTVTRTTEVATQLLPTTNPEENKVAALSDGNTGGSRNDQEDQQEDEQEENQTAAATQDNGAEKNEAGTKMYCN